MIQDDLVCYFSMDNPQLGVRISPKIIRESDTRYKINLRRDEHRDSISTAYSDTTNKRIAMSSSDNHSRGYNTIYQGKQMLFGGYNFRTATITTSEEKWGNDVIKYYLSNNSNPYPKSAPAPSKCSPRFASGYIRC